jgi:uncharacterized protein (DUF697 family)
MSNSAEKGKAIPTRKRLLFEMHQKNAPKSGEQQLSDAVMEENVTEVAMETVVSGIVSATASIESHVKNPFKKHENEQSTTVFRQDKGAPKKLQESHDTRDLSAMELAELKFTTDKAVSHTAAASASEQSPREDSNIHGTDEPFQKAMTTLHTYSAMSAATGLIPLPLVDIAGLMTLQLLMLKKLCKLYNIPFDSQRSKSAIAILVSGVNSGYIAASSSKWIPFIGGFSMAAMPVVNGALSYAVGRVFIKHFASGGTFLDFDPVKARDYFEVQFRK